MAIFPGNQESGSLYTDNSRIRQVVLVRGAADFLQCNWQPLQMHCDRSLLRARHDHTAVIEVEHHKRPELGSAADENIASRSADHMNRESRPIANGYGRACSNIGDNKTQSEK